MSQPAVCFGSPSPEHDISILTGLQAARALANTGINVIALYWSTTGDWYQVSATTEAAEFADGLPSSAEPVVLLTGAEGGFAKQGRRGKRQALDISAVINCCHGVPGEDGTLQAMFDLAGLRYTGPSQSGAAIGMDKLAFTGMMQAAGVPVLALHLVTDDLELPIEGPFIVKPRFGGSSIGIHVVDDLDTAKALTRTQPLLAEGAVIQKYLTDATDLNISIRTWPELSLSAVEKPLRDSSPASGTAIYSYSDKYLGGTEGMASAPRELPADLPTDVEAQLRSHAAAVASLAMVRSVARIDFLWNDEGLWVNEINTIPGSLSWYFWAAEGVGFEQLLSDMVTEAVSGPTRRFRTEGADGAALRSVGAIASKLG
jgi:D-alanine-D-alanine ligase